jgi:hypothetical protein
VRASAQPVISRRASESCARNTARPPARALISSSNCFQGVFVTSATNASTRSPAASKQK